MKNHDKAWSKVHGFILLEKHAGNDTANGMEKTVKERPVKKEKVPELFINGENTVAVLDIKEFKRHRGSTFHGIFIATGGAKAAVAAKRYKFKFTAVRAAKHGAAKRRIAAVKHPVDIFHLRFSGMKSIFNFFVMVFKNIL